MLNPQSVLLVVLATAASLINAARIPALVSLQNSHYDHPPSLHARDASPSEPPSPPSSIFSPQPPSAATPSPSTSIVTPQPPSPSPSPEPFGPAMVDAGDSPNEYPLPIYRSPGIQVRKDVIRFAGREVNYTFGLPDSFSNITSNSSGIVNGQFGKLSQTSTSKRMHPQTIGHLISHVHPSSAGLSLKGTSTSDPWLYTAAKAGVCNPIFAFIQPSFAGEPTGAQLQICGYSGDLSGPSNTITPQGLALRLWQINFLKLTCGTEDIPLVVPPPPPYLPPEAEAVIVLPQIALDRINQLIG
ncbi:hypothetical protein BDK51DRAFT_42337 [Blyttiomyces helicus]|uniref:Uncharacterized protein n=1 Tax=Blyttiomyces helicus TaxID=388810 RepID=A0A4P9VU25_9FUNG|nr:hypothetical protein BDK51DRAFT_42337 [Blyttiomyces helicus]|eukprot:RKO83061.1 hypothetical protein BDK51DRAFT_42337 [Blyttiomyces helicus]